MSLNQSQQQSNKGAHPEKSERRKQPLCSCIDAALDRYFEDLDGYSPGDLYQMVIGEIEKPLLNTVMKHCRGNQSRASELLGISRSTLRKKLLLHELEY